MRIRYVPLSMQIPRISIAALLHDPALAARFAGKVVFAGVTSQTAAKDWLIHSLFRRARRWWGWRSMPMHSRPSRRDCF